MLLAFPRVTVVGTPRWRERPVHKISSRSAPPISAHLATIPAPAEAAIIGSPRPIVARNRSRMVVRVNERTGMLVVNATSVSPPPRQPARLLWPVVGAP